MTPGLTCHRCERPFNRHPARRTDDGWEHARRATVCHRAYDLAEMVTWGENAAGAAMRLGITPDSLWTWCQRSDCADLWDALAERDAFLALGRDKNRGYYADLGMTA